MRIPLPQRVSVAPPGNAPQPNPRVWGAEGSAVASGTEDIAQALLTAQKARDQQDRKFSLLEADVLSDRLEEALVQSRAGLATITDPDERLKAEREAFQAAEQEVTGQSKGRFTGPELQRQIGKLRTKHEAGALATWQKLRNERTVATLETGLARNRRLAGAIDLDDDVGFQERVNKAAVMIGTAVEDDARSGELGVLKRPDGGHSSEISITVTDPRLNGGQPTNIPLLVKGQTGLDRLLRGEQMTQEQEEHAIKRAAARVKAGASLPGFASIGEAVKAAGERSDAGGSFLKFNSTVAALGGEDAAAKRTEAERAQLYNDRATRHAQERPGEFLARHRERYWFLEEGRRNELVKAAEVRRDHLLDQSNKVEKAREQAFASQLKADKEALVTEFSRRTREATSEQERVEIVRDLNLRQELRQIDQVDYDRIYDEATNPKGRASDPDILARVGLDAKSGNPRTRPEEIDRLHDAYRAGAKGLNYADAARIKGELSQTAKAATDHGTSEATKQYNQAEQELRAWLGIRPGMIERLTDNINTNDPITRLYAQGLAQLRARAFPGQGTESPFAVVDELGPRLQRQAGVTKELQAETLRQTLLYPTRQALEQAYTGGGVSRPQYLYELRQFKQLDRLAPPATTPSKPPKTGGVGQRLGQ